LYKIRHLNFYYQLGSQQFTALNDISLELPSKKMLCLCGPSGSGKSTLLNLLGLIERTQVGELFFDGDVALHDISEPDANLIRRTDIGFVFQSFHLFEVLNAYENVAYFLNRLGLKASEVKERVEFALNAVAMWEHRTKKPLEMSGGQRQRVAIARALAKNPKVIIADEPTASLDQKTGENIMKVFSELNREHGLSLVVSSHDPMVLDYCKNQVRLRDGQVESVTGVLA